MLGGCGLSATAGGGRRTEAGRRGRVATAGSAGWEEAGIGIFPPALTRKCARVGARVGSPNPYFYRLGAELRDRPSKFFEGLRV